jgi:hypothetical protein
LNARFDLYHARHFDILSLVPFFEYAKILRDPVAIPSTPTILPWVRATSVPSPPNLIEVAYRHL